MKKLLILVCVLCLALVPAMSCMAQTTTITVLAAASLTDVLDDIIAQYKEIAPDVEVITSYAGSGSLQTQIEQGAPADLFISAAQKQMNALQEQELIDEESRLDLLENKVVMILPMGKTEPATFETIGDAAVIAIGDPESVPVGQYSMEIFDNLGLTEALTSETGKLIRAKDVREVLTYVSTGNVDAGIVYATDAMTELDTVTIVANAPEGSHKAVIYPAAVLKDAAEKDAAAAFLAYLTTEAVSEVFVSYGFTALTAAPATAE